mmetsp:Transcript_98996/g.171566  ORF Transcript_98996/g.171566 Transcript_98996/m.171566 type:complete len:144 (-) Transcript_98996:75-506(-)
MDPAWFLLYLFLLYESFIVFLLCLPMPSNSVRQVVILAVRSFTELKYVKYVTVGALLLNIFQFWNSWEYLSDPHPSLTAQAVIERLRKQRGAYIAGFGIFLCLVYNRLVHLQEQLHECREIIKESEKNQGKENVNVIKGVKAQ